MSDLSQSLALSQLGVSKGAQEQAIGTQSGIPSHTPVTLDQLLIPKPASTVIFPVRDASAVQYGLTQGDLLIVERDATPADNQLVIISANDDLIISRFNDKPVNTPSNLADATENGSIDLPIWGVVTYIIQKQ
jgi:SOS-response transcriptional repressor LexA